jgi:hypothetical protein
MLTRLNITRGEGQLVEPSSQLSRRRNIKSPQASRRYSPSMAHEDSHGTLPSKEETFKKSFYDMIEIARLQGESSNPPKGNGDSGDKTPKGNGGNGDSPPPSPPSSTSYTISQPPPNSLNEHGKTPLQNPLLKLDIKFEFPMYNGEVNAEKLDN